MTIPKKNPDTHYLITVSDIAGTRHFRIPKFLKTTFIGVSVAISLALVGANLVVFSQQDALTETKSMANSLEDAFVKLTSKHSSLNKTLELTSTEKELMSEVIAQMEQISGVNTGSNSTILDRLTALSDYFVTKELDFDALDGRVNILKASIEVEKEQVAAQSELAIAVVEERIELALNNSQQKILHDSIPNGYPTRNIGVTSSFGKRKHPTTNQLSFHNGVDLKASLGTNVYATADGVIKFAEFSKLSGKRVTIAHNFGFESRYAHLSEMSVSSGDIVQKGDIIGLSGNTGRSDGPHLHYEVRYLEKAHNPIDFLTWEFGNQDIFTKVRGIQWQSLISLINKQISRPTLQLSQLAPKSKAL